MIYIMRSGPEADAPIVGWIYKPHNTEDQEQWIVMEKNA